MNPPDRGEIWWGEIEDIGRRPFLILTRSAAIPVLNNVVCAPITTTIRNIPSELSLDTTDGMPRPCAATMDNIRVVPKSRLVSRIVSLRPERLSDVCDTLSIAMGC